MKIRTERFVQRYAAICLFGGVCSISLETRAENYWDLYEVQTPSGLVEIKDCDNGDFECLYFAGTLIDREWSISFTRFHPSIEQPEYIFYIAHGGGNAMPSALRVIDVTNSGVGPTELAWSFSSDFELIEQDQGEFEISIAAGERDEYGDAIVSKIVYDPSWPIAYLKPNSGVFEYISFVGELPHVLLSHDEARLPLIEIIGNEYYIKFRESFGPQTPITLEMRRWLVGTGCMAHSCDSNRAVFVIDIVDGTAYAMQFDVPWETRIPTIYSWGRTSSEHEVWQLSYFLDDWLEDTGANIRQEPGPLRVVNPAQPANDGTPPWVGGIEAARDTADTESSVSEFLSAADIYQKAKNVVYVVYSMNGETLSQGSAVAVSPIHLLTNCHVLQSATEVLLASPLGPRFASVVSRDDIADRCILEAQSTLPEYATIREPDTLVVGEIVYSVGAPAGAMLGDEVSIGEGIVSGYRRIDGIEYIQTTAPVSSGSSGGGLFDASGKLLGITTWTISDTQNLNFAIPADNFTIR
ncbi:MAG: trypsin-like peptidase domain-containing protein [Dongiaceae bacterium]